MDMTTAWVKPPTAIGGLDHLAVQAPCITIYSQLLPGITNVTDRARYYSLYPWLIWSFDKRFPKGDVATFETVYRRSDCLLTLIAERHARALVQSDERHGSAMVGRDTLVRVVGELDHNGDRLSTYATRDDVPTRYFKNRLGGLGQYYGGVLRDLEILAPRDGEWLKYTKERGEFVAKAVDAKVDADAFFQIIDKDKFTLADLDRLTHFCPCALEQSRAEYDYLLDLFFDRSGTYGAEGRERAKSLALILHLADSLPEDCDLDSGTFRAAVYTACLPGAQAWRVPQQLRETCDRWRIYQRNELFSIACQGLLAVALSVLGENKERFATTGDYASWFAGSETVRTALQGRIDKPFKAIVAQLAKNLPEAGEWDEQGHELSLAAEVLNGDPTDAEAMYRASFDLLAALVVRDTRNEAAYGSLVFPPGFLEEYPLNLASLRSTAFEIWPEKSCRDVAEFLCKDWGLDVHLRVALRKLRFDTRATFRVRPTERGLELVEVPPAVNTNPRFSQATQMLIDLGALRRQGQGRLKVSALGRTLLGEVLGR